MLLTKNLFCKDKFSRWPMQKIDITKSLLKHYEIVSKMLILILATPYPR